MASAPTPNERHVTLREFFNAATGRVWLWLLASLLALLPNAWDILKPLVTEGKVAVGPAFSTLASVFFITTLGYIDAGHIWKSLESDKTARREMKAYAFSVCLAGVACTVTCWAVPEGMVVPITDLGGSVWGAGGALVLAVLAEALLSYEHKRWPQPTS